MDSSTFDDLASRGWTFVDSWLKPQDCQQLKSWATKQMSKFQPAAIASGAQPLVRSDKTLWLEGQESTLIRQIFSELKELKSMLNQELSLPINTWECHLAYYPPGSFYQAHIDQPEKSQTGHRLISFVLYLNSSWQAEDGGHLIIHDPNPRRIEPIEGRLVLFNSQKILHEVEKTQRERWSMTGWFRRDSF